MKLHLIKPAKGSVKTKRRLGRGTGSGLGGTSTKGNKGAQSRTGYKRKLGFEGGQMPLQRRIPKFGFKNPHRIEYKPVNLDTIQKLIDKDKISIIDIAMLEMNGFVSKNDLVKILGRGELKSKIEIKAHGFSKSAIEKIEKAGGKATKV